MINIFVENKLNKLSNSEAGYLGYLASKNIQEANYKKRVEDYYKNPKLCAWCGKPIPYGKTRQKFCSQFCNGSFTAANKQPIIKTCKLCSKQFLASSYHSLYCEECKTKSHVKDHRCLNCDKELSNKKARFCDSTCYAEYEWKQTKRRILETGEFDISIGKVIGGETQRRQAKRFLIEEYGHKCAICGLTEWMGSPIPLIVDHIDGNPLNHKIENFRLVCGNCDMQLDTYKSKNKGKGRKYRRALYQTDKESELR